LPLGIGAVPVIVGLKPINVVVHTPTAAAVVEFSVYPVMAVDVSQQWLKKLPEWAMAVQGAVFVHVVPLTPIQVA